MVVARDPLDLDREQLRELWAHVEQTENFWMLCRKSSRASSRVSPPLRRHGSGTFCSSPRGPEPPARRYRCRPSDGCGLTASNIRRCVCWSGRAGGSPTSCSSMPSSTTDLRTAPTWRWTARPSRFSILAARCGDSSGRLGSVRHPSRHLDQRSAGLARDPRRIDARSHRWRNGNDGSSAGLYYVPAGST